MTDYDKIEQVQQLITEVLGWAGVTAKVEFEDSLTKGLIFNIDTPDSQLLIGRQGATLHSLEILMHAIVAKKLRSDKPFYFSLDIHDYKRKREWMLKEMAREAAEKFKRTGMPVELEPMPNYERRLVHAYMQEHYPQISTESQGREPHRWIVINKAINKNQ